MPLYMLYCEFAVECAGEGETMPIWLVQHLLPGT